MIGDTGASVTRRASATGGAAGDEPPRAGGGRPLEKATRFWDFTEPPDFNLRDVAEAFEEPR